MRRIFPIFFTVVFVFFLSVPVFAFDYQDYITSVTVDGDNDLVTVVIPSSEQKITLKLDNNSDVSSSYGSFSYSLLKGVFYNVVINPFPNNLLLEDIPDGATFTVGVTCFVSPGFVSDNSADLNLAYYDNGTHVGSVITSSFDSFSPGSNSFSITTTIDKPTPTTNEMGCSYWLRDLYFIWDPPSEGYDREQLFEVTANDCVITFSISSLLRLQQSSNRTNKILQEVEKQLSSNGQTLDDVLKEQQDTNEKLDGIINRPLEPDYPDDSDKIGDLGSAEDEIFTDTESGRQEIDNILDSGADILQYYTIGLNAASWILSLFLDISFFSQLLTFSLSLGIFASLVNLGTNAYSAASRSEARQRRSKGKGG